MRIRSSNVFVALVVGAFAVGAAPAAAETTTFTTQVVGTVFNECTGEAVAINGTAHTKVTDNSSTNGLKSQIAMNLTGVQGTTLTGARYLMNSQTSDMQHAEFDPLGNAQMTFKQTENLTRQGELSGLMGGDDFRLHLLIHLTVSNGIVRADKYDLRADCR